MANCYVGLGGNTGDVENAFRRSLDQLDSRGPVFFKQLRCGRSLDQLDSRDAGVFALSGLYRTRAVGRQAGEEFLNAAVLLRTTLEPEPLLDLLHDVEHSLGRTRELHWGPRTIDLDLLMYESRIVRTPRLTVPHPACWYRRFVLDPLADIAAQIRHPERQLTVAELRDRLLQRPLRVALLGGEGRREELSLEIARRFGTQVEIDHAGGSRGEPALSFCFPGANDESVPPASRLKVESGQEAVTCVLDVIQATLDTPVQIAAPEGWWPGFD